MRLFLLWAAAVVCPLSAWGESWPTSLPAFKFERSSESGVPLQGPVLEQGFGLLIDHNVNGAAEEVARAKDWARGRKGISLSRRAGGFLLTSAEGEALDLSEGLGSALARMNGYFSLKPAGPPDIEAALLSPSGVAAVQALFEESIAGRLELGGKVVLPELGGEATIGPGLTFHPMPDPMRPLLLQILKARDDYRELSRLCAANPEKMRQLDESGTFRRLLASLPAWEARDNPPREKRQEILRQSVDALVESDAHSYVNTPASQLSAMVGDDWSGLFVGRWHIHPPDYSPGGWQPGEEPSDNDMAIARATGQNLTISFDPGGFDAYDLSALEGAPANDYAKIKKLSYRSPQWRAHFQELHDRRP